MREAGRDGGREGGIGRKAGIWREGQEGIGREG